MTDELTSARFLTALNVRKIGAQTWMLLEPVTFYSAWLRGTLTAPEGFQTNFASIPRAFWVIFPPTDVYDLAATIHDGAYAGALYNANGDRPRIVKDVADKLFREALAALGVGNPRRWIMFQAVHRFGSPEKHPLAANRDVLPSLPRDRITA